MSGLHFVVAPLLFFCYYPSEFGGPHTRGGNSFSGVDVQRFGTNLKGSANVEGNVCFVLIYISPPPPPPFICARLRVVHSLPSGRLSCLPLPDGLYPTGSSSFFSICCHPDLRCCQLRTPSYPLYSHFTLSISEHVRMPPHLLTTSALRYAGPQQSSTNCFCSR